MWQMDNLKKSVLEALPGLPGSREDWTDLLDLSLEHQLPEVRTMAIQKMTTTFPSSPNAFDSDLIGIARKYKVRSWFKTGLRGLVQRTDLLSDADAEILGWRTVLKLCRIREDDFRRLYRNYYGSGVTIENEFQAELKDMDN
jgi:hypothetical protein